MTPSDATDNEARRPTEAERAAFERAWAAPTGLAGLSAVNQTVIGKRYLVTGLCFFLLGGIMALLMRTQLAVPENDLIDHELYNQLFTMHGTTMLFLFAVPILEGAAVYLIPPMIGSRDLAFPRLSAFGYWCYLFGGILLYSSLLFGVMPDAGWTMYTPLSNAQYSPGSNVDFWLIGITLVEVGSVTAAAELAVSILKSRAPGMSLDRMPLFAWYMLVVSFMILIGFPPLIMGDLLLELERTFDWPFFDATRGGHDLLWQHLFWIFGHPEVYIIFLPAAGFVSMILATFTRIPTVGYFWLVVAAVGTGFVSFGLWVHHMFATGIPMISLGLFSAASMTVAIFSGIQVFAWIATLWLGRPVLKTPLLFVAGFIFLFVAGGLSGVMHAAVPFDWQTHSSYFLVAHFHYVLIGGMVFPLFAAFYYWFPLTTGRMLSERLGKWHFWLLFIGFNVAFFPMHISGLMGMPRRIYTYADGLWEWENLASTIGTYIFAVAVLLFIWNVVRSRRHGTPAGSDPWGAGTLEWAIPTPLPNYNFRSIPFIHSRYPLWEQPDLPQAIERGECLLPTTQQELRLGVSSSAVNGEFDNVVIQPKPSYAPLVAALGLTLLLTAILAKTWWLTGVGGAVYLLGTLYWLWRQPDADEAVREGAAESAGAKLATDPMQTFGWTGTIIAVIGDAALFVSLVFAFFYLWAENPAWPPGNMTPFEPVWPALGAVGLLLGSVTAYLAARLARSDGASLLALLVTALVGLGHAGLQVWLLLGSDLSPRVHAYGAMVYTLAGFHLAHLGIALLMLGFSMAWILTGRSLLMRRQIVRSTALFWHYMVVMGLTVTALAYLWPHIT